MSNRRKLLNSFLHGDGSGWCLARIVIFVAACGLSTAHAQFDANVSASFRTYPQSGIVESEFGYGVPVWGTPSVGGTQSGEFGYIRPFGTAGTSVTYNSLGIGLDVYPISFLGIRGGAEYSNNARPYNAYDCNTFNCTGTRYRSFYELRLLFGNQKAFGVVRLRKEKWSQDHELAGNFIDPNSGLAVKANGDAEIVWNTLLGVTMSDKWKVLLGSRYAAVSNIEGTSQFLFAGGMRKWEPYDVVFGLGTFETKILRRDFTIFFSLSRQIYPSIGL